MQITIIKDISEFKALEEEWNALLSKSGIENIFLTFDWLFNWWLHFGTKHSLFTALVHDNGGIIAILPFMLTKKFGFRKLAFIGGGICDYEDLIISGNPAQREEAIVKSLETMRRCGKWDILQLKGIREDSPNFTAFTNISQRLIDFKITLNGHKDGAPYLLTSGPADKYYSGLRKKFISDTKRQKNRLLNDFPKSSVFSVTDPGEIPRFLEEMAKLHRDRRSSLRTKSIFEDQKIYEFFCAIAKKFMEKGWLSLDIVNLEGAAAAMHFGFRYHNRFYYYIPVFNERFNKYSIGRLLLFDLLDSCFNGNYERIDLMSGEEPYKFEWNPSIERLYFLNIYPDTPQGSLAYLCFNKLNLTIKKVLRKKY